MVAQQPRNTGPPKIGSPKLIDSAIRACIKNLRSLTDVGDFEYRQIKPILNAITSPEQLHQIEVNSPQIKGEDAELWQKFIARDIPTWKTKNYAPKNPFKWYEVYKKYMKEEKEEEALATEALKLQMAGLTRKKELNVSQLVSVKDRSLPKLPRDPRMIANNGGVPIKGNKNKNGPGYAKVAPSSLNWSAGNAQAKVGDPRSVLARARREAKEIAAMGKLATPTHQLKKNINQVRAAPKGMANEYRVAAQPALKILSKRKQSSSISGGIGPRSGGKSGPSLEEREAKLRALTGNSASSNMVEFSDDEDYDNYLLADDDDEEEGDDLFDEKPSRPVSRPAQASSSPPARHSTPQKSRTAAFEAPPTPPLGGSGTASPAPPKPMMPRKRPPIDVFNRGAKKVRR